MRTHHHPISRPSKLRYFPVFCAGLLLCISAGSLSAQSTKHKTSEADEDGPSLKDTATWLVANLPHLSASYVMTLTGTPTKKSKTSGTEVTKYESSVSSAEMNNCHMTITEIHSSIAGGVTTSTTTVYELPLELMKSVYIGVNERQAEKTPEMTKEYSPATSNVIHIGAVHADISSSSTTTTGASDKTAATTASEMTHLFEIQTDDAALGGRVERALLHAVHLCQSTLKPEPF